MNIENTARLYERFDHLYRGRHLPATQNSMCYGFCCGDGWFRLIWELSKQIEVYGQQHFEASDLMAVQVKQKIGELRFYTEPKIWNVEYLIEATRIHSLQTCELTGAVGEFYLQSQPYFCYFQTLCSEKAAELGFVPSATTRLHLQLPPHPPTRTR